MGWSIGFDSNHNRDIGYGVPAVCDHPDCNKEINRGLSYVCGGEPYGGEHGCGLFFCMDHLYLQEFPLNSDPEDETEASFVCDCCANGLEPFHPKPDVKEWCEWKRTDESWSQWRAENPEEAAKLNDGVDKK